ncbi:MAG: ZIP zinc transporter [Acidobacteria bacterium]|nr:ZIP zinc transporter [Acidobacteriota bacterium]MBF86199.1 ZIP zinc transporter [Acidobacteriota bacterium]MCH2277741.1 ZIP family metal transporter [Vicinamibacterales bacterium]MEC7767929.1 ZIP family metal transporter [Acidobacteriota bacterium]
MRLLVTATALSLVGTLGGLLVASLLLPLSSEFRNRIVPWLLSYAVGTLLGVALLALVPEALDQLAPASVLGALLAGILMLFVVEKLVLWRHCHTEDCDVHDASATLILIGGALHNLADGAVIAASVLISIPLGISTALAVAAHQIPQEVGDFAVLLNAGFSRRRALLLNALSASSAVGGAIIVYAAAETLPNTLPYLLAVAAGSFLYVAMADLIPHLHKGEVIGSGAVRQVLLIGAGVGTILAL